MQYGAKYFAGTNRSLGFWCSSVDLDYHFCNARQWDLKEFTFEPVSPGIPRPPSIPARPYETHHLVKIGFSLWCIGHSMLFTHDADTEVFNVETCNTQDILTVFPGFPLIPGGPGDPRSPYLRKEERKTDEKRCKRCDKIMNSAWCGMIEASNELKIMSGLTGGPLSPLSPLRPAVPGTPWLIQTRIHESVT